MSRLPTCRSLTLIGADNNRIHEWWVTGLENFEVDIIWALRAPSPLCNRLPCPTNAVSAASAPLPFPNLVVLGLVAQPKGAAIAPLLESPVDWGEGLPHPRVFSGQRNMPMDDVNLILGRAYGHEHRANADDRQHSRLLLFARHILHAGVFF
ncbi:hypothetical protein D1007_38573 [Hordeum vulgare]|nr:hypothetical protein D1007_38573 [Hordeum vulgare]